MNNDHNRNSQLQHIKDTKSRSFAHRFNEQNYKITQSNIKFLNKLEKVKSITRYTSQSTTERLKDGFMNPVAKRKVI